MNENSSDTPFGAAGRLGPVLATTCLLVLLVAVPLLLAAESPVTAAEALARRLHQPASQLTKSSGQLPLKVPAAEFASVGQTGQYRYWRSGGFISPYDDNPNNGQVKGVCLRAPVYLPDGVRIDGFKAYVLDVDKEADISRIELRRAPYRSAGGTELMAAMHTSGDYLGVHNIQPVSAPSVALAEVDNDLYSYLALVCMDGTEMGNTLRLYTLAIDYGFKTYVPLVTDPS